MAKSSSKTNKKSAASKDNKAVKPKKEPSKRPAAKKAATKKASAKKAAVKKAPKSLQSSKRNISAEEHYRMIQTAAYFRALQDGFLGDATNYWIEAEREIGRMLDE